MSAATTNICETIGCSNLAQFYCTGCDTACYCSRECQALAYCSTHCCNDETLKLTEYKPTHDDKQKERIIEIDESSDALIGIGPFTIAKTAVQITIAAKQLSTLGRIAWAKRKAAFPEDKKWLVELSRQSSHKGFWSLLKSTGFPQVLAQIEAQKKIFVNLVVVPTDTALDVYFRRITNGKFGVNDILQQAAATGLAGNRNKDIISELLAAHFFSFPSEGRTCVRIAGTDKNPLTVCGPLGITSLRLDGLKEFLRIKKSILRGPETTPGFKLQAPTKVIVAFAKKKARKQDRKTFILLVGFTIVPASRSNQFKIVKEGGKKRVRVTRSTKKKVQKIRKARKRIGRVRGITRRRTKESIDETVSSHDNIVVTLPGMELSLP